jgi:hypothetical protein
MTQLLTLNRTTSQIEEALPTVDAAGRVTVPQATPLTDNELASKAYVDAQGGAFLAKSQNLADLPNKATGRSNLGWTGGTAGLAAMNVLGTTGAIVVTDWNLVGSKGTSFVSGASTATNSPVAGKAFAGHWTAVDASNGILSLVEVTAGAFTVWTRRMVAGTWDQWSKSYDNSGYALLNAANTFFANQTIQHITPDLILNDSDTLSTGTTMHGRVRFQAQATDIGAFGFADSTTLGMSNNVGDIAFNAVKSGAFVTFNNNGVLSARVELLGTVAVDASIITRKSGDARYLQLAPSPLTTAQSVTATGAVTFAGPVRGITPTVGNDFVTKAYADSLIGGGGSSGITQDQADALYVNVTGDTMSGNLNIRKTTPVIVLDNTTAGATPANSTNVLYFQALGTNFGYIGYAATDALKIDSYTGDIQLQVGTTARAILFFNGSTETARIEAGGLLNLDTSLVNRKQGDARYVQLTASTGASKSTIVEGDNIYPDYNLLDPGFYASSVGSVYVFAGTAGSAYGQQFVQLPINATVTGLVETAWVTCEVNTEYLVGGTAFMNSAVAGAGTCNLYVETGSVDAAGVVTSLGRTLIVTRTDSTTQGAVYISLTTPATARVMRFVAERPAGGSQVSRFGGFRARRKTTVAQLASDYGTTNHAIANTGPSVNLTDTDTAVSGLVSARVVLNGSDGQAGVMGFNGVNSNLYIRSEQKGITLLSDAANVSAGAAIAQFVTGPTETARVEAAGTTITAATAIVTKEKGDARYALGPKQTSAYDTTAGAVVTNFANGGSFGWGNVGTAGAVLNMDDNTKPSGVYLVNKDTTGTRPPGIPAFGVVGGFVLQHMLYNATSAVQILLNPNAISTTFWGSWIRYYNLGIWGPWRSFDGYLIDGTPANPSLTFGSDQNTGLYSDAADCVKFTTGGSWAMTLDAANNIWLGSPNLVTGPYVNPSRINIQGGQTYAATIMLGLNNSVAANAPRLSFARSLSGQSYDQYTAVTANTVLGELRFHGADGTTMVYSANIGSVVMGTPAANDVRGALRFQTGSGAGVVATRMTINDTVVTSTLPIVPPTYTVATLPSAALVGAGGMAWCSNAAVGAVLVTSNATLWKLAGTQTTVT